MSSRLTIDIVSDVSCPWCVIGFKSFEQALSELADQLHADVSWKPFELNPNMPQEGQELVEHLTEKYNISPEQVEQNRLAIEQRGADLGYEFGWRGKGRIYNTFDAHRLLHWAAEFDKQTELKQALFNLYFQQEGNPSHHSQLLDLVDVLGLDRDKAKKVLESDQFAKEVRDEQHKYRSAGISSVPAFIINNKHLISGGQPVGVFKQALSQIAAEACTNSN